jgi:hypothetical protein
LADPFFVLSLADRQDVLQVAASRSGWPAHLLEKDIWVVWALGVLFDAPFAGDLVFKGGTSLSKGYQAIERFSEDIDLTYDIRTIAPDLASGGGEALPPNRSQEKRWTRIIRERLKVWVSDVVSPMVMQRLQDERMAARVTAQADTVQIEYDPQVKGSGYVRPMVLLEFGARSTGEPFERRLVTCDAAAHLPDVKFPAAEPAVMRPERTFWEKATAIHVFCRGGRFRGAERFSRHWYDVAALDQAGFVASAIADRDLAQRVARHKSMFFREKDCQGATIDYDAAVRGGLQLVPDGDAEEVLAADYAGMVSDGLVFEEAPSFTSLVAQCGAIQTRANQVADKGSSL